MSKHLTSPLPLGLHQAVAKAIAQRLSEVILEDRLRVLQHGALWPITDCGVDVKKPRSVDYFDRAENIDLNIIRPSSWWERLRPGASQSQLYTETTLFDETHNASDDANRYDYALSLCRYHHYPPLSLLRRYYHLIKEGGFILGACFGPDTLIESRNAWQHAGVSITPDNIPDMHDVGDLMLQAGFNDPVVDSEHYFLETPSVDHLIDDLQRLYEAKGALSAHYAGLITPRQWRKYRQALNEVLNHERGMTVEVVYFHGWKLSRPIRQSAIDGAVHVPISRLELNSSK